MSPSSTRRPTTLVAAVCVVLAALALSSCGDDGGTSNGSKSAEGGPTTEVKLTDIGCEPREITVEAGPNTFHVTNTDTSAVTEFEILDPDRKIVGEVENITAGLEGEFDVNLKAGSYITYCPGGAQEDGELTAT
jgi:iron uptake system component EfeO